MSKLSPRGLSPMERLRWYGWTERLVVSELGPCWEYLGGRFSTGYGRISNGPGRALYAHRVIYENTVGPIPKGLVVRHRCDNRVCVNPDHLETGTYADNSKDMVLRGRSLKGENHNLAKLTEDDVRRIRHLYNTREISQVALGRLFGVSNVNIADIVHLMTWKEVV